MVPKTPPSPKKPTPRNPHPHHLQRRRGEREGGHIYICLEVVVPAGVLAFGAHMLGNCRPVSKAIHIYALQKQQLFICPPVRVQQGEAEVVDDAVPAGFEGGGVREGRVRELMGGRVSEAGVGRESAV